MGGCRGCLSCVFVGGFVSATRFIYLFWAAVTLHINALSIIMKLYIKRNNIEVESIRFRKN